MYEQKYLQILKKVVRYARHVAGGPRRLQIAVERAEPLPASDHPPEMLDFSRGGCRLGWDIEARRDEPLVVKLADEESGLSLELPAIVRWCRAEGRDAYTIGCQFQRQLDHEELEELFLAGFLASEAVESGDATPR